MPVVHLGVMPEGHSLGWTPQATEASSDKPIGAKDTVQDRLSEAIHIQSRGRLHCCGNWKRCRKIHTGHFCNHELAGRLREEDG